MFESNFMEFFSHVHPATPVVLYTPVIGYMLYASFAYKRLSVLAVAGVFVVGVLIFSLPAKDPCWQIFALHDPRCSP